MRDLARRVAARHGLWVASQGWSPLVPEGLREYFSSRIALSISDIDRRVMESTKESVYAMVPSLIKLFGKVLGSKYGMTASRRRHEIFVFFSEPNPVDAWSLHITAKEGVAFLNLAHIPYKVGTTTPDFSKITETKLPVRDPDLAGLTLMRLAKVALRRIV